MSHFVEVMDVINEKRRLTKNHCKQSVHIQGRIQELSKGGPDGERGSASL